MHWTNSHGFMLEHQGWHREVCWPLPELGQTRIRCISGVSRNILPMNDHQLLMKCVTGSSWSVPHRWLGLSKQHPKQWKGASYVRLPKYVSTVHTSGLPSVFPEQNCKIIKTRSLRWKLQHLVDWGVSFVESYVHNALQSHLQEGTNADEQFRYCIRWWNSYYSVSVGCNMFVCYATLFQSTGYSIFFYLGFQLAVPAPQYTHSVHLLADLWLSTPFVLV